MGGSVDISWNPVREEHRILIELEWGFVNERCETETAQRLVRACRETDIRTNHQTQLRIQEEEEEEEGGEGNLSEIGGGGKAVATGFYENWEAWLING